MRTEQYEGQHNNKNRPKNSLLIIQFYRDINTYNKKSKLHITDACFFITIFMKNMKIDCAKKVKNEK